VEAMLTVECPFCSAAAHVEGHLEAVTCDGCGVTVDVFNELIDVLDVAA
jgi:hypothetical protein